MKAKQFTLLLLGIMSVLAMGFRSKNNMNESKAPASTGEYVYFHSYGSKANGNYESKVYVSDVIWIDGSRYGEEFKAARMRYEKKFKSEIMSDYDDEADYVYMVTIPSQIKDKEGFELERAKYIKERKNRNYEVKQIYL